MNSEDRKEGPIRGVLLDRDGTLIEDRDYIGDPALVRLLPGVREGIHRLHAMGVRMAVVTNQSGVARGFFTLEDVRRVNERLVAELGIPIPFYVCPHWSEGRVREYAVECNCRKPKPGLLVRARRELGLAPGETIVAGDSLRDLQAGRVAGLRTALVVTGREGRTEGSDDVPRLGTPGGPDYVVRDLGALADLVARLADGDSPLSLTGGGVAL